MKILKSTEEGVWTESTSNDSVGIFSLLPLAPGKDKQNKSAKKEKLEEEISSSVQEIYEKHKPVITENDSYNLISASIILGKFKYQGIINYRLNGTHQQLRIEGIIGIK